MVQTKKTLKKIGARGANKRNLRSAGVKPKSRIQQANESKIIDAAIKVFSRHGFRGATLDEIAAHAGLSKPNLLYYFKTKDALYEMALSHVLDIWLHPLERLDAEASPEDELARYIEMKMQMSRDFPEASRMYAMEMIEGAKVLKPTLETRLAKLTKSKTQVLSRWTREGKLARINGIHLLFTIWAITQHYADFETQVASQTGANLSDEKFFKEVTQTVKKIIFHGVLR